MLYGGLTLATLGWWFAAFHTSHQPLEINTAHTGSSDSSEFDFLSPLQRDELQKALSGDTHLMSALINAWDIDAQLLEQKGVPSIERLPQGRFLRSQVLGRLFTKGLAWNPSGSALKFLPQTYVSASFLMAFVPSEQIVAIPKGLRKLTQIYSAAFMERIPYDIDRYHTEILFQAHPDIAFVAHYSDPATLQTLQDQGIRLFFLKDVDSLESIQNGIQAVGNAAGVPEKAELLALFIESALLNMDNRLRALRSTDFPNILYLDYYEKFALPTEKTLKGKLLKRLGINSFLNTAADAWSLPFTREELAAHNPSALIIAASNGSSLKEQVTKDPSLAQVGAIAKGHVYTVDEAIQDSPTQYMVLAYYDLFRIVERVLRP
jgi:iron complex transport system substrate-binding protein